MRQFAVRAVAGAALMVLVSCARATDKPSEANKAPAPSTSRVSTRLGPDSCPGDTVSTAPSASPAAYAEEQRALAQAPLPVTRSGAELTIDLGNGHVALLRDCHQDGGDYVDFRYAGYVPRLYVHVIDGTGYEDHGVLLLRQGSGTVYYGLGDPVVAPDSVHFLMSGANSAEGEGRSRLEVWRVERDTLVREFVLEPEGWSPSSARWIDSSHVELWRVWDTDDNAGADSGRMQVVRTGPGWDTIPASPAPPTRKGDSKPDS